MPGQSASNRRWMTLLLCVAAIVLGVLAIKRAINGNADLSGNYRLWRDNLTQTHVPVLREGPAAQDQDSYPPVTYAIYAPFGMLPLWATATLWYLLNLGCTVYLWKSARLWLYGQACLIPENSFPLPWQLVTPGPDRRLALAVIAVLPAWVDGVLLSQNTLFLMCLTWGAYQSVRHNRSWLAGGLLAVATVMKVFPVVFLLPFILRRNLQVMLAYAITGIVVVLGLGSLYFGPRLNFEHHLNWLRFAAQGATNRPADPLDPNTLRGSMRYHNQSIEAVLARLMMPVPITKDAGASRVNLVHVSATTWRMARSVITGLLGILGLLALYRSTRSHPSDRSGTPTVHREETSVETYALLCLLQLFVSPIIWWHYCVWLFWPLMLVLELAHRGRRGGDAIYVAWLLSVPLIAIPQVRAVGLHLWLMIAMFIWLCWPMPGERGA